MEKEGKQRELKALLQSGVVRDRTQLHALLEYLGARAIEGTEEPLKEHRIGVEALGKPSEYDPRIDPTVRVEVAKLRKKLEDFYRDAGAGHSVRILIPKGSYLPVFVTASTAGLAANKGWGVARRWALPVVLAIAAIVSWMARPTKSAQLAPELEAFWGPHFMGATPTLLVYGAPLFLKIQGSYFRNPDVNRPEDFAGDDPTKTVLDALKPRESRPAFTFTGVGEAEALFYLARMMSARGVEVMVRRSNTTDWEDLKGKHVVFLGGRKYNRQIPEFPFKPKFEAVNRRITNLDPRPGEPAEYRTVSATSHGEITEEYALISVYPGLTEHTRLVALECSSTEGTLAAAEFVTRPDKIAELIAHRVPLGLKGGRVQPFQVVIGAKLNRGTVVSLFYKNHRTLS